MPLARFPLIFTRCIEEATRIQSRINAPVKSELLDRKTPFAWRANRAPLDSLSVVASRFSGDVRGTTQNLDAQYSLVLARKRHMQAEQGGDAVAVLPGQNGVLASPDMPAVFQVHSGYEGIQIAIPAVMVERAVETLSGVRPSAPVRFALGFDATRGPGAEVARLVRFCVESFDADGGVLDAPLVRAHLAEALVYGLVLGLPHDHTHRLRRPTADVTPRYVRKAEEFIEANAHRHVAMADLVAATGVSARALFAGFRQHRKSSPMSFLRARRFELARHALLASPGKSVTEVALACGFEHLGRFSAGYKARFGEGPAETLRRRRG